jgi:hypothetical protein
MTLPLESLSPLAPLFAALVNVLANLATETMYIPVLEEMDRDEYWYGYGLDDDEASKSFRGIAPWDPSAEESAALLAANHADAEAHFSAVSAAYASCQC